jgi:2-iminobutanoate/2-iminopropanoate deaminase
MNHRALTSTSLPAPGGAYSHLVEVGGLVFTAGFGAHDPVNAVYARMFPRPFPVRTTVGSGLLGILVEIDVVAAGDAQ